MTGPPVNIRGSPLYMIYKAYNYCFSFGVYGQILSVTKHMANISDLVCMVEFSESVLQACL